MLIGYFISGWNCAFRVIYKVDIFVDMDEENISKDLTTLLPQLNKGARVDMGQVVHVL